MINWEHAEKVLDAIDANPAAFNMGAYDCGTSRCIAGHAANLAGVQTRRQDGEYAAPGVQIEDAAARYLAIDNFRDGSVMLFSASAFRHPDGEVNLHPTTDEIRARLKEIDNGE